MQEGPTFILNSTQVGGIIYGRRDSDTKVPVEESFDWVPGVITMGAALESVQLQKSFL